MDFTEVTFNCTIGVCKMGVKAESRINLCIHFTTGLIGECNEDTDTEVCTPGLLLECHPKPNLATALVDAFLPSFSSQEPLIIYPITEQITDFNNLKKSKNNGRKSRVLLTSSSRSRMSRYKVMKSGSKSRFRVKFWIIIFGVFIEMGLISSGSGDSLGFGYLHTRLHHYVKKK